MADGSVEAVAEGPADAVDEFRRALERGPSYSHVTAVEESELQPTGRNRDFGVVRSQ